MIRKIQNTAIWVKIFMFFIAMGVVITVIFTALFYDNALESAINNKEKEMVGLANITSNKIERFMFERIGDVEVLAQSKIFFNGEISDEIKLNFLENVMQAYQTYDAIYVVNNEGEVIFSVGDFLDITLEETVLENTFNPSGYISNIMTNANNQQYIYFSFPVFDSAGLVEGAIIERMNFSVVDEILKGIRLGNTGFVILEESDKDEIYSTLLTKRLNGTEYYVTSSKLIKYPTQTIQWHVSVLQHRDEVLVMKNVIERYIGYIIIASMLIFLGVSYFISRRITQPIRNLMKKINALMINNEMFGSDLAVSDEMKLLTSSFDILLEELQFMMQQVLEKSGEAAYIEEIRHSIESLFEHIPNGIITVDGKGVIGSINEVALEILECQASSLLNQHLMGDVPKEISEFFKLIYKTLFDHEHYNNEIFRLEGKNGKIVPIVFSTLRQHDLHNNLIGITVIINLFDAKCSFEESILRAKKLAELGELSAGVAHEIRNPLASIKGYAQVALLQTQEDSQLAKDIKVILAEVARLEKLIDRFMTFASPSLPELSLCHMNDIIRDTMEQIQRGMSLCNIKIQHKYTKSDLIYVDYDQIKQVILNLILNAIQSMPEGGTIELLTVFNEYSHTMEIHVIDSGQGIPPDVKKKMFSPFFTTRDEGTGLGLAISSRIIENHKGIISVESEMGKGTKVIVKLPFEKGLEQ